MRAWRKIKGKRKKGKEREGKRVLPLVNFINKPELIVCLIIFVNKKKVLPHVT